MKKRRKDREYEISRELIFIVLIGLSLAMFVFYPFCKNTELKDNECLIKIAQEFCEDKGLEYHSVTWEFGNKFKCGEEKSTFDGLEEYRFIEEDMEGCLE